jgi:hypothetical protein
MVTELSARHALPQEVVEVVAARTGGGPLFVEEVTRLLLERGGEQGGVHAVPPTLQQLLTARLDRLGSAREVAQVGAVIGRDFSYKLLREIAGIGDAPPQTALERLADADFLPVQGLPPASDYRFKQALIQDAAYENLQASTRFRERSYADGRLCGWQRALRPAAGDLSVLRCALSVHQALRKADVGIKANNGIDMIWPQKLSGLQALSGTTVARRPPTSPAASTE